MKNQIKALGKMLRYGEAIANVIYKGFYLVFSSFYANILPRQTKKILKLPRHFVANIFSPWILKANFAAHWVTLFWLFWNFGYFLQTQHENDSSAMLNSIHKTFRVVPKLLQYQRFSVRSVPKFEVPIFYLAKNFLWWHWVISFFLLS